MNDPVPFFVRREPYRVRLLAGARAEARGVVGVGGEAEELVDWSRVRRVFCAEVGEPEGVCTVVFDLAVEIEGPGCVAYRVDADPGSDASALAGRIEASVAASAQCTSLREIAKDGVTSRWFPDTESFEDANLASLRGDRTLD